jgi:predicted acyl esterase
MCWGASFFQYLAQAPDPAIVGEKWREMWRARLENLRLPIADWLAHQHYDDYWKQGSVREDYGAIEAAVYAIGGWADGYSNAVPRLIENLKGPKKGLIGPWAHKYPHIATPHPAIDFMNEALRWWDHWLKGRDTGIMKEPVMQVWLQDSIRPAPVQKECPGRWVAFPSWPHATLRATSWNLGEGTLTREQAADATRIIDSPLETGLTFGEWCPYSGNGELPDDQRADDGRSVVFETAPLATSISFVGTPLIDLEIEIDDETALLAGRLQDVHPDGASLNVSYGLLNVAQREGADRPKPFPSGHRERVRLRLNDAAHVFPAGHRIRIALSNAFWPLAWPSPRHCPIMLHTAGSCLTLPVLPADADLPKPQSFGAAIADDPEAVTVHASGGRTRQTIEDPASGEVAVHVHRSKSDYRVNATGTEVSHQGGEVFRVTRGRPNSARIEGWGDWSLARGDWQVRTRSSLVLASTERTFELSASMEAYEADELIMRRDFNFSIPRRLV